MGNEIRPNNLINVVKSSDYVPSSIKNVSLTSVNSKTGTFGNYPSSYSQFEKDGTLKFKGNATVWNDIRFPFTGQQIDTSAGRIDYNYFNGAVGYAVNARFPEEAVSMVCQMPHNWKVGSLIYPHLHWLPESPVMPNWLLAYRIMKNGSSVGIVGNYSGHTLVAVSENAFSYAPGIFQISKFGSIDMSGAGLSDVVHFVLFRDSTNIGEKYSGVDTYETEALAVEFDVHYEIDTIGSRQEFVK